MATLENHFKLGDSPDVRAEKRAGQELVIDQATSSLVRALAHHCKRLVPDKAIGRDPIGFSTRMNALWYRRDDVIALVRQAFEDGEDGLGLTQRLPKAKTLDVLRDRGQFTRKVAAFLRSDLAETWSAQRRFDVSRLLDDSILRMFRKDLSEDGRALPFAGVAIGGYENALNWIGFRLPDEVRSYLRLNAPTGQANDPVDRLLVAVGPRARATLVASEAGEYGKPRRRVDRSDTADNLVPELSMMQQIEMIAKSDWRSRVSMLERADNFKTLSLLRTIACFEEIQIPASQALVRQYEERSREWFDEQIGRLHAEGWLTVKPRPGQSDEAWWVHDPEEQSLLTLNPSARTAILASLGNEVTPDTTLNLIIRWVAQRQTVPPPIRIRLLYQSLGIRAFEDDPQGRVELLITLLPDDDVERVRSAVDLARYNPHLALRVVDEYVARHATADEYFPSCLAACADDEHWDAFEVVWKRVVERAHRYTEELIAHLTTDRELPWSQFTKAFWQAAKKAFLAREHFDALVELYRISFARDEQVWTLWIATPEHVVGLLVTRELLRTVDETGLSPAVRAYYEQLVAAVGEATTM